MKKIKQILFLAVTFLSMAIILNAELRVDLPPERMAKIFQFPGGLIIEPSANLPEFTDDGYLLWSYEYHSPSNTFFPTVISIYKGKTFYYYSPQFQERLKKSNNFLREAKKRDNYEPPFPHLYHQFKLNNNGIAHYLLDGMGPGGEGYNVFATTPDNKYDIAITIFSNTEDIESIETPETKAFRERILKEKQGVAKLAIKAFPEIYSIIEPQLRNQKGQ